MLSTTRPIHGTQTAPTYPKGRRCYCGTILSQYNKHNRCWQHRPEGRQLASLNRRYERERFADMILEVMESE